MWNALFWMSVGGGLMLATKMILVWLTAVDDAIDARHAEIKRRIQVEQIEKGQYT